MGRSDGDKVAVTTGAGSGLGRALAVALGRRAWTVVITDVDMEGAAETQRLTRAAGGEASVKSLDVRDPEAFEALAQEVWEAHGRCDLLVNNAGVAVTGAVGKVSLDDWRWCLDIDLMGVVHGCHVFAPRMSRQGRGHIVNIASIAGYAMGVRMAPYNVAKAGVIALSETLRGELLGTGVGVTVVCPGFFKTSIAESMRFTDAREQERTHQLINGSGLGAEQVAGAILKAIDRNAPYLVLPRQAQVLFWMRRLLPARATELMLRSVQRARTSRA